MSETNPGSEYKQLEQAIDHLESQRAILGDAVVDVALAPLREKLAQLERKAAAPSPVAGERRIVTILFSDVTGSTALASRLDPEEWVAIMNQVFRHLTEPVERFGGTVARLMGDGILAFFGAPVAHEDDPVRAAMAGLEILRRVANFRESLLQERALSLDVRVGINTGLAVVGAVGTETASEYTALGDAVNLAARMEQTAVPGTLQISEATHRLVSHYFLTEELGRISVKGIAEPVPTFRVLGRKEHAPRNRGIAGISAPMVGRRAELERLQGMAFDLAGNGSRGRVVSLIGEAGLGKSRLLSELESAWRVAPQIARDHGSRWQMLTSTSYSADRPYASLQALIQNFADISPDDTAGTARAKLHALLMEQPGHHEAVEVYEALLGLETTGARVLAGDAFRRRLIEATSALVRGRGDGAPAVMVFEDAHWTDSASLDVFLQLLDSVREQPILFLFSYRPDRECPMWQLRERFLADYRASYDEISLQPLTLDDGKALIGYMLADAGLPAQIHQVILSRAEGNPFFLEEIVRVLVDRGLLTVEGSALRWRKDAAISEVEIPANVHSLLASRIDRLTGEIRRTLQLASVIGRSFYYRVLALITESAGELDRHLSTLQAADLVHEASRLPEWEFLFRHALTQEAAYRTLLRGERRAYHRRVGLALEQLFPERREELAPLLAKHFSEAREDAAALNYHTIAGDTAFRLYANVEAITHYRKALSLALRLDANNSTLLHLYTRLGRALDLRSEHAEAVAIYEELVSAGQRRGDQRMLLVGLNRLATVLSTVNPQADFSRGLALAQQALELSQALNERAEEARAHWNLMLVRWYGFSDPRESVDSGEASLAIAREDGLTEQQALTQMDLGLAYGGIGDWARGARSFEEACTIWRLLDDRPMLANNRSNSAIPYLSIGDLDSALAAAEEAREISRAIGNEWGIMSSALIGSFVLWELGRAGPAIRRLDALRAETGDSSGLAQPLAFADGIVSWIAAGLGNPAWSARQYEEAVRRSDQMPGVMRPWHLATLSLQGAESGNPSAADQFLEKTLSLIKLQGPYSPAHIVAFLARGRASYAAGRYSQAIDELQDMIACFNSSGVRWFVPDALLFLGRAQLALGLRERAHSSLTEALQIASAMGSRRVLWQILAQLASLDPDQQKATAWRLNARSVVRYVADNSEYEPLRASFLALPAVLEILSPHSTA